MNRCIGCGSFLQDEFPNQDGYTSDLNNKYCERCFRITHYSEFIISDKKNEEFLEKIDYINSTSDLVILTCDFLNIINFNDLKINNPIILAFTKRDLLPRSVNEDEFLKEFKCKLNVKSKLFISSKTNYNLDKLMSIVNKYKKSNNVYLIGLTNSGKSMLINKLLKNYESKGEDVTVSSVPSTTLDFIKRNVCGITFIDTPGLLDKGSVVLDKNLAKKIIPKSRINPKIYQVKVYQTFIVEDIIRIDLNNCNIIFYMSNDINIYRYYKDNDKLKNYSKHVININSNEDLVIKGLGFITFKNKCTFNLYLDDVEYFIRKSIF